MHKLLAGRRLLVVEDEMLILMTLEDMLADLGCESVTAASSVEGAIALLDVDSFDAALLDVNLNGHKSAPVADRLVVRGIPFVVATGNGSRNMGDSFEGKLVLTKPFRYEQLVQILERLLLPEQRPHSH